MKDRKQQENQGEGYGSISVSSSPFLRWLDNFWYHYKWPTIGIAFAVIVILVCTLQTCSRESQDVKMIYAGPAALRSEQITGIDQLLDQTVPEDFDGDGEKNAMLLRHTVFSKEQIQEIQKRNEQEILEKGEEATEIYINTQFNSQEYESLYREISGGAAAICLLDPWLYEELKPSEKAEQDKKAYLRKLYGDEDSFFSEPIEGLLEDGYGVRLGETELYRKYKVLQALPEDTVICLVSRLLTQTEQMYTQSEDMFRAMVG